MKNNVLVVAAHPDDELLGLGGTLCKHRNDGDAITILILANGEDSRDQGADPQKRLAQAQQVAEKLGAKLHLFDLPDNQFDTIALLTITKQVENKVAACQPNIVYTHHADDLNVDHRKTFEAVLTACRPQPGSSVKKILSFETLSSTEWQAKNQQLFKPNYYIDITDTLKEKQELLSIYHDELREHPHPRSLEGVAILAHYRGIEVGVHAAEAFTLIRQID